MPTDDPLSHLLKTWRHQPPDAPRFQSEVWARIEADGSRRETTGLLTSLFGLPTRHIRQAWPLAAALTVMLSVLAGAGAGWIKSQHRTKVLQADAYVRTIDPLQMTGSTRP